MHPRSLSEAEHNGVRRRHVRHAASCRLQDLGIRAMTSLSWLRSVCHRVATQSPPPAATISCIHRQVPQSRRPASSNGRDLPCPYPSYPMGDSKSTLVLTQGCRNDSLPVSRRESGRNSGHNRLGTARDVRDTRNCNGPSPTRRPLRLDRAALRSVETLAVRADGARDRRHRTRSRNRTGRRMQRPGRSPRALPAPGPSG